MNRREIFIGSAAVVGGSLLPSTAIAMIEPIPSLNSIKKEIHDYLLNSLFEIEPNAVDKIDKKMTELKRRLGDEISMIYGCGMIADSNDFFMQIIIKHPESANIKTWRFLLKTSSLHFDDITNWPIGAWSEKYKALT